MSLNSLDKKSKIFFPYKNAEIYYSLYEKYGFFILKNCFTKIIIKKIINEIKKAKGTNKYLDQNNLPRRIEKIYNKGVYLRYTNEVLLKILKEIFSEKFSPECSYCFWLQSEISLNAGINSSSINLHNSGYWFLEASNRLNRKFICRTISPPFKQAWWTALSALGRRGITLLSVT